VEHEDHHAHTGHRQHGQQHEDQAQQPPEKPRRPVVGHSAAGRGSDRDSSGPVGCPNLSGPRLGPDIARPVAQALLADGHQHSEEGQHERYDQGHTMKHPQPAPEAGPAPEQEPVR